MKKLFFFFIGFFLSFEVSAKVFFQIQQEIEHSEYEDFFEYAKQGVDDSKNECAKFVNRIFWARFKKQIWGNAWDIPVKEDNKKFIEVIWKIPKSEFKNDSLWISNPKERLDQFYSLYRAVDQEQYPIGILGFLYKYSEVKEELQKSKLYFPQTHVSFLAGKKWIQIKNESNKPQTIQQIFEGKYGIIHDFEKEFVNKRLKNGKYFIGKKFSLETIISPGNSFWFYDYLIEEQFRFSRKDSLLGLFLRKHRNNKTEQLFRPVSFSRISDELILELEKKYE